MQSLANQTTHFLETVTQKCVRHASAPVKFIAQRFLALLLFKRFLVFDTRLKERCEQADAFFRRAPPLHQSQANSVAHSRESSTAAAPPRRGASTASGSNAAGGSAGGGNGWDDMGILHAPPPPPTSHGSAREAAGGGGGGGGSSSTAAGGGAALVGASPDSMLSRGDDVTVASSDLSNVREMVRIVGWQYAARKTWTRSTLAEAEAPKHVADTVRKGLSHPDDLAICASSDMFGACLDGLEAGLNKVKPVQRKQI